MWELCAAIVQHARTFNDETKGTIHAARDVKHTCDTEEDCNFGAEVETLASKNDIFVPLIQFLQYRQGIKSQVTTELQIQ